MLNEPGKNDIKTASKVEQRAKVQFNCNVRNLNKVAAKCGADAEQ